MANHQSVCLHHRGAFLDNVVCDLDLWTHDLGNVDPAVTNCQKFH